MLQTIVQITLVKGLLLSLCFTGMLLIHHFFGPGPDIRDAEGKKVIPPEYRTFVIIEMVFLIGMILGFGMWANATLANRIDTTATFWLFVMQSYAVYWLVNLWDLVVIDWGLVVRFRPSFLELPDEPYFNTMRPHVTGWLLGHLYVLPLAAIAAGLSVWIG